MSLSTLETSASESGHSWAKNALEFSGSSGGWSPEAHRRIERRAAFCALLVALAPLIHWILWFGYFVPQGFKGLSVDPLGSLHWVEAHLLVWRGTMGLHVLSVVPTLFLQVFMARLIRPHSQESAELLTWFGIPAVLAAFTEGVLDFGILPWILEREGLSAQEKVSLYMSTLPVGWLAFWLAILAGGAVQVVVGLSAIRIGFSRVWAGWGIMVAIMGGVALDGLKSLRIVHGISSIVWFVWLAVLLFRAGFPGPAVKEHSLKQSLTRG